MISMSKRSPESAVFFSPKPHLATEGSESSGAASSKEREQYLFPEARTTRSERRTATFPLLRDSPIGCVVAPV